MRVVGDGGHARRKQGNVKTKQLVESSPIDKQVIKSRGIGLLGMINNKGALLSQMGTAIQHKQVMPPKQVKQSSTTRTSSVVSMKGNHGQGVAGTTCTGEPRMTTEFHVEITDNNSRNIARQTVYNLNQRIPQKRSISCRQIAARRQINIQNINVRSCIERDLTIHVQFMHTVAQQRILIRDKSADATATPAVTCGMHNMIRSNIGHLSCPTFRFLQTQNGRNSGVALTTIRCVLNLSRSQRIDIVTDNTYGLASKLTSYSCSL